MVEEIVRQLLLAALSFFAGFGARDMLENKRQIRGAVKGERTRNSR